MVDKAEKEENDEKFFFFFETWDYSRQHMWFDEKKENDKKKSILLQPSLASVCTM